MQLNDFIKEIAFSRERDIRNQVKILDVGGCSGKVSLPLASIGELTIIDKSKKCEEEFIHLKGNNPRIKIEYIVGDFLSFDFKEEKYNMIFSSHFLHLFSQDILVSVFEKIWKLLATSGIMLHVFVSDKDRIRRSILDGSLIFKYSKNDIELFFQKLKSCYDIDFKNIKIYYKDLIEFDIKRGWHKHNMLVVEAQKPIGEVI